MNHKVMDQWLIQTKDLGGISEKELVQQMWNGSQSEPHTAVLQVRLRGNQLRITCATPGASIAYREKGSTTWEVYSRPIAKPQSTLEITAMRIGYLPSQYEYKP